jgi:hypothetical protein
MRPAILGIPLQVLDANRRRVEAKIAAVKECESGRAGKQSHILPQRLLAGPARFALFHCCDFCFHAASICIQDLQRNPKNGWAHFGLSQALQAQNKNSEAASVDNQFREAWKNADVSLTASAF